MVYVAIFAAKFLSPIIALACVAAGYRARNLVIWAATVAGSATISEALIAASRETYRFSPLSFVIAMLAGCAWILIGRAIRRWAERQRAE